jgi:hypothetical protein
VKANGHVNIFIICHTFYPFFIIPYMTFLHIKNCVNIPFMHAQNVILEEPKLSSHLPHSSKKSKEGVHHVEIIQEIVNLFCLIKGLTYLSNQVEWKL